MSTQHASGHHLNVSLGDGLWDALHVLADRTATLPSVASWEDLTAQLDALRRSDNLFCAIRVEGTF